MLSSEAVLWLQRSYPPTHLRHLLAEFFFIAGIESSRIYDGKADTNGVTATAVLKSPGLDTTFEKHGRVLVNLDKGPTPVHGASDESLRDVGFSYEPQKSIVMVLGLDGKASPSNRSSATIRAVPQESIVQNCTIELDFDQALRKFATERDSFLEEIRVSAGQVAQPTKPRPRPRTQRITNNDEYRADKNGGGAVRRRLSLMNPLSRSATTSRRSK